MKKFKKGFTLIELLIVIALLGTLAVALLAALDPLEQIKKGNDTGVRNTVTEIQGAFVRYTSLQGGIMPFSGTVNFMQVGGAGSAFDALQKVIAQGELKSDFVALSGKQLDFVYLTGINDTSNGTQTVNVCYAPTSKSFKMDGNTKFVKGDGAVTDDTGQGSACPQASGSDGAGNQCYWCVR